MVSNSSSQTSGSPPLQNDLLLRAARSEDVPRAPVWVMRQAGRYLPEFRKVREQHDFFSICRTPELACEITLQPIRRYRGLLDAAIIFSDILVVPQALGMTVEMLPGEGPHFPQPLVTPDDAERLLARHTDVQKELGYVFEAIKLTRRALAGEVPLIGFCGAPWTLFAYMVEGSGSKTFQKAKVWLWDRPELSKRVLERIAEVSIAYLVGQVHAGAQLLQIFDSWAGELAPHDFAHFALPYLRQISSGVRRALGDACPPLTVFAKGANHAFAELADSGYDTVGLDWTADPRIARQAIGNKKICLQGNMDPSLLYASKEAIEADVKRMSAAFGTQGGWIANLGHGITPAVDPESMRWFLSCVHRHSKR